MEQEKIENLMQMELQKHFKIFYNLYKTFDSINIDLFVKLNISFHIMSQQYYDELVKYHIDEFMPFIKKVINNNPGWKQVMLSKKVIICAMFLMYIEKYFEKYFDRHEEEEAIQEANKKSEEEEQEAIQEAIKKSLEPNIKIVVKYWVKVNRNKKKKM